MKLQRLKSDTSSHVWNKPLLFKIHSLNDFPESLHSDTEEQFELPGRKTTRITTKPKLLIRRLLCQVICRERLVDGSSRQSEKGAKGGEEKSKSMPSTRTLVPRKTDAHSVCEKGCVRLNTHPSEDISPQVYFCLDRFNPRSMLVWM